MDNNVIKLNQTNFYQICRICYKQKDLKNIFQSKYRNVTFANILEHYVHLKISENDGLSPNICLNCIKSLLLVHTFLDQYKLSNESLKSVSKYLYKNNNRLRTKYMQINLKHTNNPDSFLTDCCFIDFNPLSHKNDFNQLKPLQKHSSTTKLQRSDCKRLFKTPSNLSNHQKSTHVTPNVICAICNRTYTMKYQLRRHLTVSHTHCTCDTCGLQLKRSSLTKHHKTHAARDYLPRNRSDFNAHTFRCDICAFESAHWTSLHRHKLRHKEKPFLCNTCGKDFSGKLIFDKHMNLHELFDKPTPCYVCSDVFYNEYDYSKHLSTHTYYVRKITNLAEYSRRKQKYKQRISTKTPEDDRFNKSPKRIPDPKKRKIKTTFKCAPCDKTFKDNAHLRIHVTAIHENKRQHKCPYCGKGFNLPNALQEHLRTHTGETLPCDYCEKTFRQNSTRYKHLREAHNVHLGQIRREKSKERREKDEIRRAYKKLKMKMSDVDD